MLLDCGADHGHRPRARSASRATRSTRSLVSHFHGDHFGGIPALLLAALYEDGAAARSRVAGPPGVEARVRDAAAALGHALDERELGFALAFDELPPGARVRDRPGCSVARFATHHQPDSLPARPAGAEAGGRRIAYSGDTGWFDELPRQVARRRPVPLRVHLRTRRASSTT